MALRTPALTQPRALRVDEVARVLSVSTNTVRRWISAGALDVVSLPAARGADELKRVPASEIDRLLKKGGGA